MYNKIEEENKKQRAKILLEANNNIELQQIIKKKC